MLDPRTGLEILDAEECWALLAAHHVGRLGLVVDGRPVVLPVNYALDGRAVVFRTDPGTAPAAAVGNRVALEIDETDAFAHRGWSVLCSGRAEGVDDPAAIDRLTALPLGVWIPGPAARWVRIGVESVTGRRIPARAVPHRK